MNQPTYQNRTVQKRKDLVGQESFGRSVDGKDELFQLSFSYLEAAAASQAMNASYYSKECQVGIVITKVLNLCTMFTLC